MRSPENLIKEFHEILSHGAKSIEIYDEFFSMNKKRCLKIIRLIKKEKMDFEFRIRTRVDSVDAELLRALESINCTTISYGVESGNQKILDNIRKGVSLKQIKDAFKLCHKHKMDTHAHLMVGCVGENWDTVNDTVKFIKMLNPTTITCGAYTLLPGTDIFDKISKEHPEIKDGSDCSLEFLHERGYFSEYICEFSDKEVGKAVKKVYAGFYLRPNYFIRTLLRINSLDEFRRVLFSAVNVFSFIFEK